MVLSDIFLGKFSLLVTTLASQIQAFFSGEGPATFSTFSVGVSLIICVALLAIATNAIDAFVLHPLRRFPGPPIAALTHLYQIYHFSLRENWADTLRELHKKHGPIIRIGRNELHVMDAEFMYKYINRRDVTKCETYYNILEGALAGVTDTKEAMKHRAHAMPAFTGQGLKSFAANRLDPILDQLCARIAARLSEVEKSRPGNGDGNNDDNGGEAVVDMSQHLFSYSTDVTNSFLFGESGNWLATDDITVPYQRRLFGAFRFVPLVSYGLIRSASIALIQMPWLGVHPSAYLAQIASKGVREYFARTSSDGGPKQESGAVSFLGSNYHGAERDSWEFMLTGSEAFTTEIAKTLQNLLLNPDCLAKLMQEIDSLSNDGDVKPWCNAKLGSSQYLNACIKETIRQRLPEYLRISRKCAEPVAYGDLVIPPNTSVSMLITLLGSENLRFGEPDKWMPERWVGDSFEAQQARARFAGFGYGQRVCMGRDLVYTTLAKTIVRLLCDFNLSLTEDDRDAGSEVHLINNFPKAEEPTLKLVISRRDVNQH